MARRQNSCPAPGNRDPQHGPRLAVCGLLLVAVGLVFAQTARFQFINFDDGEYVCDNPHISAGLTARGIAWVFIHEHVGNWHPVTGMSHLLDCQLFGVNPGAHHLINALLQAATAVVLFLVLRQMTGRFWPSAMVAAFFAVHPLRVESVAWISERKDVLSGLCFALTLGAYVWFVRGPVSWRRYLPLLVIFALGLMAKPMLVTLPLVLLLLDYWPLGRWAEISPRRLVVEKVPLFLLSAASCLLTVWAQSSGSAINLHVSFASRITNASVSYVRYLVQFFWPVGLAAYYPHPEQSLPAWQFLASLLVLACLSLAAWAYRRRYPYLLVGWLWFLGMLVPVSGICQAGSQGMADRFTYLPHIGVYFALTWAAVDLCRSWPYRRWLFGVVSALVLAVFMGCAWRQTSFWHDSETLWTHALACTSENVMAHTNLGAALTDQRRFAEAIAHFETAVKIQPGYAEAYNNLGVVLGVQGRLDEAILRFQKSLGLKPDNSEAHNNLGYALAARGRLPEAIDEYHKALDIKSDFAFAHRNLGNALAVLGRLEEAMGHYQETLEFRPDDALTHFSVGRILTARGRFPEAAAHYRKATEAEPRFAMAHAALAWLLATCPDASLRNGGEALQHAQQAAKHLGGGGPETLDVLAAAYAEAARFPEALAVARKALQMASQQNNRHFTDALRSRIALYEAGKPYHLTNPPPHGPPTK